MTTTNPPAAQAGSYRVGDLDLNRIGYGAMQLAGPGVLGPPRDRAAAIEVLRTAVELGVNHIDTAHAYGPYVTNEITADPGHLVGSPPAREHRRRSTDPATRRHR
jgi:predicted oxidoreductase